MLGRSWDDPEDSHDSELAAFDYLSPPPDDHDEPDDWSAPRFEGPADEPPVDPAMLLFSVTSPAGTVTAKAAVSGRIQRIELSPHAVSMSESQLIRDVIATAKLANLKGRSAQYSLIEGILSYQGLDQATAREFLDQHLDLPTPEQAAAAENEAHARYLRGEH